MMETLLSIAVILVLVAFAFLVYRFQRRKEAEYIAEQIRLDTARAEAIRTGNIFSAKNFRQVEARLKVTHPHLNRKQRKEKANKVREQFIMDVKAGMI